VKLDARGFLRNVLTNGITVKSNVFTDKRKENRGTLRRDHWSR